MSFFLSFVPAPLTTGVTGLTLNSLLLDAHLLFLALKSLWMPDILVSKLSLRPGRLAYLKMDSKRVGKP